MSKQKVTKPVPSPSADETEQDFMSRCMEAIAGEYEDNDQAAAICLDKWDNKKSCEDCVRTKDEPIETIDLSKKLDQLFDNSILNKRIDLNFQTEIKTLDNEDADFEAIINTSAVDRDGDVVLPAGLDSSQYSGVVCWQHNYDSLPVAKTTKLNRYSNKWTARGVWANHELAQTVKGLVEDGIPLGASVGFMPTQMRSPTREDKETFGKDVKHVISRYKLLEWSFVTIPSNQETLVTALRKSLDSGKTTSDTIKKYFNLDIESKVEIKSGEDKPVEIKIEPEVKEDGNKLIIVYRSQPKQSDFEHSAKILILKRQGKLYE